MGRVISSKDIEKAWNLKNRKATLESSSERDGMNLMLFRMSNGDVRETDKRLRMALDDSEITMGSSLGLQL